jgi:hypothetical protein
LTWAGLGLTTAAAAAAGLGSFAYAMLIEPERLAVEQVTLRLPRLDPAFNGYRLVQVSDIHLDHRYMTRDRLLGIAALVSAQRPDLIAITGDYITRGRAADYLPDLDAGLAQMHARDGITAVLGNHDYRVGARAIREALQRHVIDINNGVHTLVRGGAQLHIAGVDDIWENRHRLDQVLDRLPQTGAALLLAHEPDFADESAAAGRFDLQLSGHSHGGQCVTPTGHAPILPEMGKKYPGGLYRVGDMWQYTNRGLGMVWFPQVRFNCRPEITVFTLMS